MAVTYAFTEDANGRQRVGKQHVVNGTITLTGTYETDGFAVTAGSFGLAIIESLDITSPAWLLTEFLTAAWVPADSKIKLGWTGGATGSEFDEITNADTVTDFVLNVEVKGR